MAIARQLVELMGGQLSVESEPGVGSTFSFTVPLERVLSPEPSDPQESGFGAFAQPDRTTIEATKVLLVEDNEVNQWVAKAMLVQLGCDVDVANDGRQAVAAVLQGSYGLILMDCHMPELDGFEATRQIRGLEARNRRRRLPIVALTASAMAEDAQRCRDAGMDAVLVKPLVRAELLKVLREVGAHGPVLPA